MSSRSKLVAGRKSALIAFRERGVVGRVFEDVYHRLRGEAMPQGVSARAALAVFGPRACAFFSVFPVGGNLTIGRHLLAAGY